MKTTDLAVVQTYAVAAKGARPITHYEMHLAAVDVPAAPHASGRCRCLITVTPNEALYTRARAAEGYPERRFDVSWRAARRADGRPCQVLEALVERCPHAASA